MVRAIPLKNRVVVEIKMTKKDLLKSLQSGVVRCKIGGEMKQITRNAELTGLTEDGNDMVITNKQIKSADKGATIGVFDIANGVFLSIKNADIEKVIGTSVEA